MIPIVKDQAGLVSSSKVSRRERVSSADHAANIQQIAGELFLARGYDGVTIDSIVEQAGGSKREVFTLFGSKEALFQRVVVDMCRERVEKLPVSSDGDPESTLVELSVAVLTLLLSPKVLALHRLVIAEAPRFPEMTKEFLRHGPHASYRIVAMLLRRYTEAGLIDCGDTQSAARIFLDGLKEDFQLRCLFGQRISTREITTKARLAVALFLRGCTRDGRS